MTHHAMSGITKKDFAAIPEGINTLNLQLCQLGDKPLTELLGIFSYIPRSIQTLYLSNNNLSKKTTVELIQIMAAIPRSITTLELGANSLGSKTGEELAAILATIPASVTRLGLTGNELGNMSNKDLALVIASIRPNVTTLYLSGNSLCNKAGSALAQVLMGLPSTIKALNLDGNRFNTVKSTDVTQSIAAIPDTVTELYLDDNGSELLNNFVQICANRSQKFKLISLSGYELGNKKLDELMQIFSSVSIDIKIIFDEEKSHQSTAMGLLRNVLHHTHEEKTFIFDDIQLPEQYAIGTNKFNELIDLLKQSNLPIANLTCALLLTEQIRYFATNEVTRQQSSYWQQAGQKANWFLSSLTATLPRKNQTQEFTDNEQLFIDRYTQAIDFYQLAHDQDASLQPVIKTLMHFLSWDINHDLPKESEISDKARIFLEHMGNVCNKIDAQPALVSTYGKFQQYSAKRPAP